MDSIAEIITTFSNDDIKSFRLFINRQKKLKTRKDIELFNLLLAKPEVKANEAIAVLYESKNEEAYHAVRKSLLRHIMDFLVLKQFDEDTSSHSAVMGIIGLSQYLFDHKKFKLAWKYLVKAENIAQNNNYYNQLNTIYLLQIEKSQTEEAPVLQDILEKFKKNKILADQTERAEIALNIIKQELSIMRLSGKEIAFDSIVNNVIEEYHLQDVLFSNPRLFYQVMSIFRSAVVAGKDYFNFEPYVIRNYQLFIQRNSFQPKDEIYRAGLLYMIAHTLYRNKKFTESIEYIQQLSDCVEKNGRVVALQYLNRQIILTAANTFFLGSPERAISILQDSLITHKNLHSQADILNIKLNSCFYYLYSQQPSKANQELLSIEYSNKRCEKLMGKEWILKKDLVEVIIQYELQNDDIALNRIKSIEHNYHDFMKQPRYERVRTYLELLKEIIEAPQKATTETFYNKVESSFQWLPVEQEDLQAVMFYAWLKSRMFNKTAYEVLLDLTGKE